MAHPHPPAVSHPGCGLQHTAAPAHLFIPVRALPVANPIRYVKAGGTGSGSSWTNASGDLQAMINASGVTEVWVAGGTFKPITNLSNPRLGQL